MLCACNWFAWPDVQLHWLVWSRCGGVEAGRNLAAAVTSCAAADERWWQRADSMHPAQLLSDSAALRRSPSTQPLCLIRPPPKKNGCAKPKIRCSAIPSAHAAPTPSAPAAACLHTEPEPLQLPSLHARTHACSRRRFNCLRDPNHCHAS